jgi:hypothetical protein
MPERQVLIESFDDASEWTALGSAVTPEDDTTQKTQGIGAVKFSKPGVTLDYGGIYKTYNGLDLGQYVNYKLDVFIPEGFKDSVYGFDIILDNSASIGDAFPGWTRSYEGNQEPNVWSTPGPAWVGPITTDRATVLAGNILEITNPVAFETCYYSYDVAELFAIGWFPADGSRYRRYKIRAQVDPSYPSNVAELLTKYQNRNVSIKINDDQVDVEGNLKVVDTTQDFVIIDSIVGDNSNNFQAIINGEFFVAGTPSVSSGNDIEFGKRGLFSGAAAQRWDWVRLGTYGANANFAAISTPVSGLVEGEWNTLTIQPKAPNYSLGIGGQPGSVTRLALVFWTKQTADTFADVIIDNLRAIPNRSYSIQPAVLMDWKLRTEDLETFDPGNVVVDGFEDASEWATGPRTISSNEISWFVEGDQSVGINRKPPTFPKLKKFVMGIGL